MASDVREYLRAAQAAEIRGDKARAAEILRTVAGEYHKAGNAPRARQMLRHAQRLEGGSSELEVAAPEPERSGDSKPVPRMDPEFAERGPTLADVAAPAWCSFCCRPRDEVGPLVSGPAGAFICAACAAESTTLLGGAAKPGATTPTSVAEPPAQLHSQAQRDAISQLQDALRGKVPLSLLVGPEGCGKTICLRSLQAQGLGKRVEAVDEAPTGSGPLLLDGAERLSSQQFERLSILLSTGAFPCVLAARGSAPSSRTRLFDGDRGALLHTTGELVEATDGKIPHELLRRVRSVVALSALTPEDCSQLAQRLFEERGMAASSELIACIAAEACDSGHGGHELAALVDRVPRGTWTPVGRARRSHEAKKRKGRR